MRTNTALRTLFAAASVLFALRAMAADFTGDYTATIEGETLKLSIKQNKDGSVTGTLADSEMTIRLLGKLEGDIVKGKCVIPGEAEDGSIGFRLEREGSGVAFVLLEVDGDQSAVIERMVFAAKGAAPTKEKPSPTAPKPSGPAGSSQKLLWGPTLSPPEGWSIKTGASELLLVPPGARQTEKYFFPVVAVSPDLRADSAEFSQAIRQYVGPYVSGMSVVADKPIATKGGPGRLIAFEGAGAQGTMRVHVYATVFDQLGVGLVAIGRRTDILARAEALAATFATFAPGDGSRDPALTGAWVSSGAQSSSPGGAQGYGRSTQNRLVRLSADGRYAMQYKSRTVISGDGYHADTGDNVRSSSGRWFAGNGMLVLISDQGDPAFLRYQISSDGVLKVTDREGGAELLQRG